VIESSFHLFWSCDMTIRLLRLIPALLVVTFAACDSDDTPTTPQALAPGAPTAVSATIGDASVSLTFAPPTSDGGAAITGYTATCSSAAGAAVTGSGSASPLTVSGLTNGTEYACVVAATNSVGVGAASTSVMVMPAPTVSMGETGETFFQYVSGASLRNSIARNQRNVA
jgi:Fibronectin type III domain